MQGRLDLSKVVDLSKVLTNIPSRDIGSLSKAATYLTAHRGQRKQKQKKEKEKEKKKATSSKLLNEMKVILSESLNTLSHPTHHGASTNPITTPSKL